MPRPSIHHIVISLAAALGLMQMTLFIGYSLHRSFEQRGQIALERVQVAALEQKVAQLKELKGKAQDPLFLEELARCQGFVKGGERVLIDSSMVGKSEAAPCAPRKLLPE